jgi:hypothetical protein
MKKKNRERGNSQLRKGILWLGAVFTAVKIVVVIAFLSGCTADVFDYSGASDSLVDTGIEEVFPANGSDNVEVNPVVGVTFNSTATSSEIAVSTLTLKNGSGAIPGTVSIRGKSALFSYAGDLKPMTEYTATIITARGSGSSQNMPVEYTWKFNTGKNRKDNSISVISVSPENNVADIALTSQISITVDREVQSWMKSLISVSLSAGSEIITGNLSFTGNTVIFDPKSDLLPNTVYSCTFNYERIGSRNNSHDDDDEDDETVSNTGNYTAVKYSWTFTTSGPGELVNSTDNIPPSVVSVVPAANTTSVSLSAVISANFSEKVDPSTVTNTIFTLRQGSDNVVGTVTCSGTTATFAPSSNLTGGVTYTATITTGVKDMAGNQLANDFTWNFSTVTASTGMSFASDVIPVLGQCNNCHKHPWTTSSVASVYYTNLVSGGYINTTNPTSSLIYTKLSGGHASSISNTDRNKILTWIKEGALNN